MKEILETIVLNIVENKNNVEVLEKIEETAIVYEVKVEKEDMGKIIGKQGKVAQAIRTLIKSIGAKEKKKAVRTIKENPTKEMVISEIAKCIEAIDGTANMVIENKTKIILFKLEDKEFKIDLIEKRTKKEEK